MSNFSKSTYVLSVSQLNEYAAALFRRDPLLSGLTVKGEITDFLRHSSGHLYFSLKDNDALVRCVMFRQHAERLPFLPENGMEVIIHGSVNLYVRDGQYQLYADSIQLSGAGELYKRFVQLKNSLAAKGMFDESHKRLIPFLPSCIGVVSSRNGAAYRDILNVVQRRFPSMNVILYHAAVQGIDAPAEIVKAIKAANEQAIADVLIVGRGGGSAEDLFCFNDESIASAVYKSKIPVISAVGHEIDFTIIDFTADLRAPTPSAAAELAVPELDSLIVTLDAYREKLTNAALAHVRAKKSKVQLIAKSDNLRKTQYRISTCTAEISSLTHNIREKALRLIAARKMESAALRARIGELDPSRMLKRGFVLLTDSDKKAVNSIHSIKTGDTLNMYFNDGSASVTVTERRIKNGKDR